VPGASGQGQRAVVVAVIAVREVQVAIDQVIHMVTVRDHFVPAAGAVDVIGTVTGAGVGRGAGYRVGGADGNHVFIDMIAVREVQVAIVQVIDVVIVTDGGMAAVRAVLMGVVWMLVTSGHDDFL